MFQSRLRIGMAEVALHILDGGVVLHVPWKTSSERLMSPRTPRLFWPEVSNAA